MNKRGTAFKATISSFSLFVATFTAQAQSIDPEAYIKKAGAQSSRVGDDGQTMFFNYTERAKSDRIASLERIVEGWPKRLELAQVCDQMRGSVKAKLISDTGKAMDVASVNYGYSGATLACVLKYMYKNKAGTQLIFMKKAKDGMYMLFVTD